MLALRQQVGSFVVFVLKRGVGSRTLTQIPYIREDLFSWRFDIFYKRCIPNVYSIFGVFNVSLDGYDISAFKLFDALWMDLILWDRSFDILNRIVWWNHIACVWWSQSPRSQRNLIHWTSYSQSSWSSIRDSLLRFFLFDPALVCESLFKYRRIAQLTMAGGRLVWRWMPSLVTSWEGILVTP